MTIHIKAVHLKIKQFKCSLCDCARYRRQEIEAHIKSNHRNEQCRTLIIGCRLCERKERHERCVKQRRTLNPNKPMTKRPSLSKEGEVYEEYTTNQKFKTRGKKSDGEYACDKCDYTCDTKQLLRNHIEAVHLKVKNYKCSSCSWVCSYNKQTLKSHIKRMHKEDSTRMITIGCSLCETNQSHKFCERKYEFYDRKRKTHVRIKKNGRGPKDKCRIKPKSTKKDAINNEEAPALKSKLLFCHFWPHNCSEVANLRPFCLGSFSKAAMLWHSN